MFDRLNPMFNVHCRSSVRPRIRSPCPFATIAPIAPIRSFLPSSSPLEVQVQIQRPPVAGPRASKNQTRTGLPSLHPPLPQISTAILPSHFAYRMSLTYHSKIPIIQSTHPDSSSQYTKHKAYMYTLSSLFEFGSGGSF
jgi:hypothetical protein